MSVFHKVFKKKVILRIFPNSFYEGIIKQMSKLYNDTTKIENQTKRK